MIVESAKLLIIVKIIFNTAFSKEILRDES